ncbi:DUF3945 domain-containing protein [Bacteroides thetaiotaomicron]|uniref:DUF3945 domain-containing protein n=1 Tax=Bacteroides thetaiotaomicron TaxID=818 RepID=UPI001C8C8736|nr:DUF3945 domain-containing protein [Bacteroides thetaiotaomicron]MBX9049600.1 DUF3945 domain-containing protein [Bacteroides thetaiotaomicron]MBX9074250.1 DUF3945 domain-containing protein [Bacteroides thetaiotaomicron]
MDENIKDQDVLLVKEKGDDTLKAVAGIDKEGNLKTVPPTARHESDFMKIDKHSNVLENFFANFMRQAKDPTHFDFFRVSVENVDAESYVLNHIFKDPFDPAGQKALDSVRVNPEDYADKAQEQSQQNEPATAENKQEQGEGYKSIDPDRVDWQQAKGMGVSRESLEKSGALEAMLNYRKSPLIKDMPITVGDFKTSVDARLSLRETPDGRIVVFPHIARSEPNLGKEFFGHKFTDEDKKAILATGNLGRVVDLKFPNRDTATQSFVSIDRQTNELVAIRADRIRIPDQMKGVTLNDEQKRSLSEGKGVYLEGMTAKTGKLFSATVQVNADKRGLEFQFSDNPKQSQSQAQGQDKPNRQFQWVDENGNINVPKKFGGVEVTPQQHEDYKNGKEIYMQGMLKDGKGRPYNAYIKFNPEKGKPDYDFTDRNQVKESVPANDSKTQVAVNTEGKTDEATKHLHDPLQKGQTQPAQAQREEIAQNHEQQKPRTGLRR